VTGSVHSAVIVGAGFGGLGMGIALRSAGVDDFVILDKGRDVGGVWSDNTYPGAACDVPSHLYSFSFEPNPKWSRAFAPQPEILAYLQHCGHKYRLHDRIRLRTEVRGARFDEASGRWHVELTSGETLQARALITACGQLNRPLYPNLPGLDRFRGPAFHSARWDHGVDLTGKRVAMIGTGASAIQIVPSIVDRVGSLQVFQRHAPYLLPKPDREYAAWEQALFAAVPGIQALSRARWYTGHESRVLGFLTMPSLMRMIERMSLRELQKRVVDPELRKKLTPDYPIGCKRILLSNDYYTALCRPNADVVTSAITEVTETGLRTADGRDHALDVLIYGTGFKATEFLAPMAIHGRGGVELSAQWRDGAEAYLGVSVHGFPNLFMLYGPNTNLGHNSIVYMLESQIHYVMECLRALRTRGLRSMDVKSEIEAAHNAEIQAEIKRSVWDQGCDSWYKTARGKHTNNWPGFTFSYRKRTRAPNLDHYELR
jgi:cation diffusion facilitator CzcD-associated flavoprotein CzcO